MKFSLSIKQFLRLQSLVNSVCRVPGLVIPARDAVRVKGADVIAPPSPAALFCLFEIPAPTPSLKDQCSPKNTLKHCPVLQSNRPDPMKPPQREPRINSSATGFGGGRTGFVLSPARWHHCSSAHFKYHSFPLFLCRKRPGGARGRSWGCPLHKKGFIPLSTVVLIRI